MEVREWLSTDETAKDFFARIAAQRPPLLPPPLHRFPLRSGNVVEIAGPSPSAKTHILLQVVVDCILPKEWKGVCYGGFEHSVLFIDLDCRFDVLRLLQLLKLRIFSANGSSVEVKNGLQDVMDWICDEELIQKCLERFQYIRCHDSFEFLATLKTLTNQCRTKRKDLLSKVRFMMIDSIGAYYWVDRASTSLPLGSNYRKMISLQSITEAIVREMRNILLEQPMLVFATKAAIFGDKSISNDVQRKWPPQDAYGQTNKGQEHMSHREYMPSVWQSFVTHRMYVRPSNSPTDEQIYLAQWLQPPLAFTDKFVVRDVLLVFDIIAVPSILTKKKVGLWRLPVMDTYHDPDMVDWLKSYLLEDR